MKVTISGEVGSGKSTVAKIVAEELGYNYFSVGKVMREMADEKNMSVLEIQKLAEKGRKIDKELDERQARIGKENQDFVMDSRLGFHFVPDSKKIFLKVAVEEAAKRIMGDQRGVEKYKDLDDAQTQLRARMESERHRYKEYYNIDFPDEKLFDLVIDTTKMPVEKVVEKVVEFLNQ